MYHRRRLLQLEHGQGRMLGAHDYRGRVGYVHYNNNAFYYNNLVCVDCVVGVHNIYFVISHNGDHTYAVSNIFSVAATNSPRF